MATVGDDHLRCAAFPDLRRKIQLICKLRLLRFSAPGATPSCHQQSGSQQSPARRTQRVPEPWRSDYPFRQSELFQVSPSLNSRWNFERRWEPGGKGSFQAFKLQRPTRAAVCSHSPEGHSRQGSIQSHEHLKKCSVERLSRCGQSGEDIRPFAMNSTLILLMRT